MNELEIRKANVHDIPLLQKLCIETITHICKKDYTEEQIKAWCISIQNKSRWLSAIHTQYFIVATNAQKIVGFGSLQNGCHIDFLYVDKNNIGKGIAFAIYTQLELKSKKLGNNEITAYVSKSAKLFFNNQGFEVLQEKSNLINKAAINNYYMIKKLTNTP